MKYWHVIIKGYSATGRMIVAAETKEEAETIANMHIVLDDTDDNYSDIVFAPVEIESKTPCVIYDDCEVWC